MLGRLRVGAITAAARTVQLLPERLDVAVASYVAERTTRRSVSRQHLRANLARVLGAPIDEALLERYVARGMASYGRYWAEGAKLPGISEATRNRRFQIAEGREHLDAAMAKGTGIVVALPHIGSWEWGGAHLGSLGMPMTAVAERLEPPELFDFFTRQRSTIGINVVGLDASAGAQLSKILQAGGVVGLLCDRDIQGNGIDVDFFGERVKVPAGPATLALRSGATLVAAACYSGPGRDHFAVVTPPIDAHRQGRLREDVARVSQAVTDELEGLIRRAPEQWHVLEDRFASE